MQILFVWKHHVDADVGVRFVGLNHIFLKLKKGRDYAHPSVIHFFSITLDYAAVVAGALASLIRACAFA